MVNKLKLNLIAILLAVGSQSLSAQVPSVGDVDASGRVYAKVVVTINGSAGSFGQPASSLRFLIVSESGDRISIRTNDAGVASTWVAAGSYRIVNPDPYELNGQAYTWDVVVPLRAGTRMIKLSQSNATKVVASAIQPRQTPNASASESMPATRATTSASVKNSITQGFFVAPHLLGASLKVEDNSIESGAGGGVSIGYGVARNIALFLTIDAASINDKADIPGNYVLAHADLGLRLSLTDQSHKVVPYIKGAFSGHAAARTVDGSDYVFSGSGGTVGIGLSYYTQPKVALDIGLASSFGSFSKLTIDGNDYPTDHLKLSGARFQIGAMIFPFAPQRISP
jgi:hypothetical protein